MIITSPDSRAFCEYFILFLFIYFFSRQGFSVALEPVLELALVYQAGLKLTEIRLPLPPEFYHFKWKVCCRVWKRSVVGGGMSGKINYFF